MESLPAVVTLLPKFIVTDERVSPYCLLGKSIKLSLRISTSWSSVVRLDIRTFPESSMRCSRYSILVGGSCGYGPYLGFD